MDGLVSEISTSSLLHAESQVDWVRANVLCPALNTAILEPAQAFAHTINQATKLVCDKEWLPDGPLSPPPQAALWTKEWYAQNISSGLAMTIPYAIAGALTGRGLHKLGALTGAEGASAVFLKSKYTSTILGAALYDGFKVTKEGETRLGNALGGGTGFLVFELGNGCVKNWNPLLRIPARMVIGMAGAVSHQSLSHLVAQGHLPKSEQLYQAALSGATMNVALPAVHRMAEKGVNHACLALGVGVPVESYLRTQLKGQPQEKSPDLATLAKEHQWAVLQDGAKRTSANGSRNFIELARGDATPERIGHELKHLSQQRSAEHEAQFVAAADLLQSGTTDSVAGSWQKYRKTRVLQEAAARETEAVIARQLGREVKETLSLEQIAKLSPDGQRTYEQIWHDEFIQFRATNGKFRPARDYARPVEWDVAGQFEGFSDSRRLEMAARVTDSPWYWKSDLLISMLHDPVHKIRVKAVEALSTAVEADRPAIWQHAIEHPDYVIRMMALDQIRLLPPESRVAALERVLDNPLILERPIDELLSARYGPTDHARAVPKLREGDNPTAYAALSKDPARCLYEQLQHIPEASEQLRLWNRLFADARTRSTSVDTIPSLPEQLRTTAWWTAWEHYVREPHYEVPLRKLAQSVAHLPAGDRASAAERCQPITAWNRDRDTAEPEPVASKNLNWARTKKDYSTLSVEEKLQAAVSLKHAPEGERTNLWNKLVADENPRVRLTSAESLCSLPEGQRMQCLGRALAHPDYYVRLMALAQIGEFPTHQRYAAWNLAFKRRADLQPPVNAELLALCPRKPELARSEPPIPENISAKQAAILNRTGADLLVAQIEVLPPALRQAAWEAAYGDYQTMCSAAQHLHILPEHAQGKAWLKALHETVRGLEGEDVRVRARLDQVPLHLQYVRDTIWRNSDRLISTRERTFAALVESIDKLPAADRVQAWDKYLEVADKHWTSDHVGKVSAESLTRILNSLPENFGTDPRTRYGEWQRYLQMVQRWTYGGAIKVDYKVTRADECVGAMINALPEPVREAAWNEAYTRLGTERLPGLTSAVDWLPPDARTRLFLRLLQEQTSAPLQALLEATVPKLPAESIPAIAADIARSNHPNKSELLGGLPINLLSLTDVPRTTSTIRAILQMAQKGEVALKAADLRKLWESIPLIEHEDPAAHPIRDALVKDVSPDLLCRLLFEDDHSLVSAKFTKAHPEIVRNLTGRVTGGDSHEMLATAAQVWMVTGSLKLTTDVVLSISARLSKNLADTGTDSWKARAKIEDSISNGKALIDELSAKADQTDRISTLQSLNAQIHLESGEKIAELVDLASSVARSDPALMRQHFLAPLEAAIADRSRDYHWRLSAARELGRVARQGNLGGEQLTLPDLRMKGKVLPEPEQQRLRTMAESALRDPEALAGLMGDGELGKLLPEVFGSHEKGGIVGRPQHGGHEYPLDEHTLLVVQRVLDHADFVKLDPKDQTNLLWAALLHDIGKRPAMADPSHEWTSANMSWGVLETLGYPPERTQRIANLISRHSELSFNPKERQSIALQAEAKAMELAVYYRNPSAIDQLLILNQADIRSIDSQSKFWTPEVSAELKKVAVLVQKQRRILDESTIPILTTALPRRFGLFSLGSNYAVLAHASDHLDSSFIRQLALIESCDYSMSSSWLTPRHQKLYHQDASIVALVTGAPEHVAQVGRENLGSGVDVNWSRHVELARKGSGDFVSEINQKIARLGKTLPNAPQSLAELWRRTSRYDNLTELTARGANDPLVQSYMKIVESMTTTQGNGKLKGHNEVKLANPKVVGFGLLRNGRQVVLEGMSAVQLQQFLHGEPPPAWLITDGTRPAAALIVPRTVWEEGISRNLPLVSLD